ncbi:putative glycosidase CRH2 [Coemansia guatemalensis]|uniref:Glycosidase CRH2 n=1 Tax=Coemansia guatemalensis TaxID=2761395 RepID=A0A9W8HUZ0_9FUNG|nr:putative glycosidase CRH2 [Coemansia guatemalensis]
MDGLEVLIQAGSGPINLADLSGSGGTNQVGGNSAQETPAPSSSSSNKESVETSSADSTESATDSATEASESASLVPEGSSNAVTSGTFSQEPSDRVYTCKSEYIDFSKSDAMSKFSFVWCPENAYQTQDSVVWKLTQQCGTTMVYPWDFHYGRIEARVRIGAGSGVVTALLLLGPAPSDEIDFEWVGRDLTHVQTMYYVQAHRIEATSQAFGISQNKDSDLSTTYQDYAIELLEDSVKWYLNGKLLRTLNKGADEFPSDASRAKMGIWDGTQTGGWAGSVDWSKGPFTAEMQWFNFTPYC